MTDLAVIAINLVVVALIVVVLRDLIASLLRPWPEPREHHDFVCPQCPCSYAAAADLCRHFGAQHLDTNVYRLPVDGGPARSAQ